jgi:MerR family transcriptional regulator, light-induced transcriptional regulator
VSTETYSLQARVFCGFTGMLWASRLKNDLFSAEKGWITAYLRRRACELSICFDNAEAVAENAWHAQVTAWPVQRSAHVGTRLPDGCQGDGMRDSRHDGLDGSGGGDLSALARTVVARLAARDGIVSGPGPREVDDRMVAALVRAFVTADPGPFQALRADLRRARISDIDLVDIYFPAAARLLGCAWVEDSSPFTEVTVGVARMLTMLHQIGRDWSSNAAPDPEGRSVLVVLPEGEQHSFGVAVLAGQLRRQGISVRLEVGTPTRDLFRIVRQVSFDCAMVSIACEEKLAQCRAVVTALKDGADGQLRVAVGGALLERPLDIAGRTGADIVTSDPFKVLQGARANRARLGGGFI